MSLDDKVNVYLKSPKGRKKTAETKAKAFKEGRTFGQSGTGSVSKDSAKQAGQKMKTILLAHLASVNLQTILPQDIIIDEPKIDENGDITINIRFDVDATKRPSLQPDRYSGVENIVVHLTHGWDAKGSVYGFWESARQMTHSRSFFAGDDFMREAVEEFNALKLGEAELNEKYL
jgi:hypothetical protein